MLTLTILGYTVRTGAHYKECTIHLDYGGQGQYATDTFASLNSIHHFILVERRLDTS